MFHATNFYRVSGGVCLELLGTIDWTEYMVEYLFVFGGLFVLIGKNTSY